MKCISCNKDSKKRDRISRGGRCPFCHHPFVADPAEHGLTDRAIKSAEDTVSSQGTLYFSKEQLKYQLQRKLKKKQSTYLIGLIIVMCIFAVALVVALIKGGGFSLFAGFSFIAFGIPSILLINIKQSINCLGTVVDKWTTINPHEKLLIAARYQDNQRSTQNLDGISFDRVLVCDRNETVDFFLSNLFHFHYSCPVLGGNGYPQGIYEDMLVRLKQNPNLKVFLLHDYSPSGFAFVRRMKTDSKWFSSLPPSNIIDLGLNVGQKKLFSAMTVKKTDRNQKTQETAEVSLFQPAALITLCGVAINEAVPLDLVTTAAADSGSSGGYG